MKYNPDMVVLADANLWTQFSEGVSREFANQFARRVWLKNLLRRSGIYHFFVELKLRKYYERYRTRFIPVDPKKDEVYPGQQKTDPDAYFAEQIERICMLLKDRGISGLLIYIPSENELLSSEKSSVVKIKEEMSEKYGISFINFGDDFSRNSEELYLPSDPAHPNVEGNRIIANRIFDYIISSEHPVLFDNICN